MVGEVAAVESIKQVVLATVTPKVLQLKQARVLVLGLKLDLLEKDFLLEVD